MTDTLTCAHPPLAAYLYILRLDGPALAWEYLRRNPAYCAGWRTTGAASPQTWGLRFRRRPQPGRPRRRADLAA